MMAIMIVVTIPMSLIISAMIWFVRLTSSCVATRRNAFLTNGPVTLTRIALMGVMRKIATTKNAKLTNLGAEMVSAFQKIGFVILRMIVKMGLTKTTAADLWQKTASPMSLDVQIHHNACLKAGNAMEISKCFGF